MAELRLGIMKNMELAEWFDIATSTFARRKKEKLEELKEYAEFEAVRGGVDIKEIFVSEYVKKNSENYDLVVDNIDEVWNVNGLDTCRRVSKKIENKVSELTIGSATVYNYTRLGRNELYGKPGGEPGRIGRCKYILCKDTENGLEFLNEEELEIKRKLVEKYYGDRDEREARRVVADGAYYSGLINDKEYREQIQGDMDALKYMTFVAELQTVLKCKIIKGTYKENTLLAFPEHENG